MCLHDNTGLLHRFLPAEQSTHPSRATAESYCGSETVFLGFDKCCRDLRLAANRLQHRDHKLEPDAPIATEQAVVLPDASRPSKGCRHERDRGSGIKS